MAKLNMTNEGKGEEKKQERKESVKTLLDHLRVHDKGVILSGAIANSPDALQARRDQEAYALNYYFDTRVAEAGKNRAEVERKIRNCLGEIDSLDIQGNKRAEVERKVDAYVEKLDPLSTKDNRVEAAKKLEDCPKEIDSLDIQGEDRSDEDKRDFELKRGQLRKYVEELGFINAQGEKRSDLEKRFEGLREEERRALLDQYHERRARTAYADAALLVRNKSDEILSDEKIRKNLIETADDKGLHELVNENASASGDKDRAKQDLKVLDKYFIYKKARDYLDSLNKYNEEKNEEERKLREKDEHDEDAKVHRKSGLEVLLSAPQELDKDDLRNATIRAAVQRASRDEYDAKTAEIVAETAKLTAQIDPSFEDARAGVKELCDTIGRDMKALTGTDKGFEAGISDRIAANLKLAIESGKGPLIERALNTIYLASNEGKYSIGTRYYDALHKEYQDRKEKDLEPIHIGNNF